MLQKQKHVGLGLSAFPAEMMVPKQKTDRNYLLLKTCQCSATQALSTKTRVFILVLEALLVGPCLSVPHTNSLQSDQVLHLDVSLNTISTLSVYLAHSFLFTSQLRCHWIQESRVSLPCPALT